MAATLTHANPAPPAQEAGPFVAPVLDFDLLSKYDTSGPRYTSYPTAPQFHEGFGPAAFEAEIRAANAAATPPPLSLYFHLPFCESVCFFCGCNVTFTSDRTRPAGYTESLLREVARTVPLLKPGRPVEQLHWGGGTPTFFSPDQLRILFDGIRERFAFAPDAELGIEVDPRETSADHLRVLGALGFNRLSLGIQDFDPAVQEAVNRVQSAETTRATILEARARGFTSVSVDLMYGLPRQTAATFARTLDTVLALGPDRVALFNFAYLPDMIRHQKAIDAAALPPAPEKFAILRLAVERLTGAGYRYIGMDHFARPGDELCRAQDAGTLYRNFQGYTTHAGCDLHAFGVSAISSVGPCYAQNHKAIRDYSAAVAAGGLPVQRGIRLSAGDLLRRHVIMRLMCDFALDFAAVEREFNIRFQDTFADALGSLGRMEADGLLRLGPGRLEILPAGRLLVRNIAMAFDDYLATRPARFSRTI